MPTKAKPSRGHSIRIAATLLVTVLCTAYVLWKIHLRQTGSVIWHSNGWYLAAATGIWLVAVWPLAWRWQRLLAVRGVEERVGWLLRAYFISYAAGQVLPTSLGGDATRIYSTSRRHPGQGGTIAASILLERILGGIATLGLAAAGLALAIGRYDVGAYLWIEGALVVGTAAGAVVLFSRRARRPLARLAPPLRLLRVERPLRAVYEGLHAYRSDTGLLGWAVCLTLVVQAARVAGIWLIGRAVGVDVSIRAYYVMGPLLFLVMLIPFTVSGLAVREAFFVSFLGKLHVGADPAFSTGILFFALSLILSAPGVVLIARDGFGRRPPAAADGGP